VATVVTRGHCATRNQNRTGRTIHPLGHFWRITLKTYNKLNVTSFINYVNSFDFVCLTETFVDKSFDYSGFFIDFLKFVAPARKLSHFRRNSGGVVLLVKKCLEHFVEEIKLDCANAVAVKLNKRVLGTDKDIVLVGCYIVPEGGPLYNNTDLQDGIVILEESLLQVVHDDDVHVMICGDLNARTGSSQSKNEDIMNFETHIGFYDEDLEESCLRHSKDNTMNNFGKSLLDLCFMFDLDIMNGYCKGDKEGEYTFVSPQGCSVIDYFLAPDFFISEL
jgi:exonuclease III